MKKNDMPSAPKSKKRVRSPKFDLSLYVYRLVANGVEPEVAEAMFVDEVSTMQNNFLEMIKLIQYRHDLERVYDETEKELKIVDKQIEKMNKDLLKKYVN